MLDAFELALGSLDGRRRHREGAQGRRARLRRAARRAREGRASSASTPTGEPFDPNVHEAVHARRRRRRARRRRGAAHRLHAEGPGAAAGHGEGHAGERRADGRRSASGSRRTTTRSSACPTRRPTKEITSAYRKLARAVPPRRQPGQRRRPRSASRRSSAAYDVLGDADKRKEYDEVRQLVASGVGPFGGGGPGGFGGGGGQTFDFDDVGDGGFGDLLGSLFGGGAAAARGGRAAAAGPAARRTTSRPSCTSTSSTPCTASPPRCTSPATRACSTCHGTGAEPGHARPRRCPQCGGRGVVDDNQGLFSFSQAVPDVRRARQRHRGPVPDVPAAAASSARPREVKVRIPAGVDDGQRIRLKGRGGAGRNGGPPGDLSSSCTCAPHPLFGRKGKRPHRAACRSPSPRPRSAPR